MASSLDPSDRSAEFVALLAAGERRLATFVLALVPNFADADEVLQETKIRLWEQFDKYDSEKSFDAWARTIAHFQVLTFRKKRGREKVSFSTELISTLAEDFDNQSFDVGERAGALQHCLEKLSKKYQTLLKCYYSGMSSLEQVAEIVEMTVVAARKAIYRSRISLHECIERRLQEMER